MIKISYKNNMKIIATLLIIAASVIGYAQNAAATSGQAYSTAEEAFNALNKAVEEHNLDSLKKIFGTDADEILSSGDPVADQIGMSHFEKLFNEKHFLEASSDGVMKIYLGNEEWPFPIPITKGEKGWTYDVAEGKEEILNRRIGRNELNAIEIAMSYVDAQREYIEKDRDGDGFKEYAQLIISSPGKRNGLFWPRKAGEALSPFGPQLAKAQDQGYKSKEQNAPTPYFGYIFRILTAQGKAANGGTKQYIDKSGRMTEGFALLAYPVQWGSSGIMSFIINQDGAVYQKNLGSSTAKKAALIKEFNPDNTWAKVE